MKTLARLLAARLLEAEPDVPPDYEHPNPAGQEPGMVDVRDFILSNDTVLYGIPEPNFYDDLLGKLGGRDKRKLDNNTILMRHEDGRISIRLHATDIITAHPNGRVVVTTHGTPNPKHFYDQNYYGVHVPGFGTAPRSWRTVLTKDRINKYLPSEWGIYSEGGTVTRRSEGSGAWYWCNSASRSGYFDGPPARVEFSDGDEIDTKTGVLKPKKEPVEVKTRSRERRRGWAW